MLNKIIDIYKKREKKQVKYPIYGIIALILSFIHLSFLDLISIAGMTPDLLIILCVWITLKEGKFVGILFGFFIGLVFDIISLEVIGTNALTKTIVTFIAGYFYKEKKEYFISGRFEFVPIIFLCSLAHNLVYFLFYLDLTQIPFLSFFLKYGLSLALYTTVVATFIMLLKSLKGDKIVTKHL